SASASSSCSARGLSSSGDHQRHCSSRPKGSAGGVSTRQTTWIRPSSATQVPNWTSSGESSPESVSRTTRSYSRAASASMPATARVTVTVPGVVGTAAALHGAATLDDADEHHHDGEDQEEVDEPAEGRTAHHSQEPEDQQDHEDRPQHRETPLCLSDTPLRASDVPCGYPDVAARARSGRSFGCKLYIRAGGLRRRWRAAPPTAIPREDPVARLEHARAAPRGGGHEGDGRRGACFLHDTAVDR